MKLITFIEKSKKRNPTMYMFSQGCMQVEFDFGHPLFRPKENYFIHFMYFSAN